MNGSKFKIRQGEIWLADLNPVKGHEQGGFRPVLVLQNDLLNKHLSTVVVAPVTSNLRARGLTTTSFLTVKESGLKVDSVALLFQVRTIDIGRLKTRVGILDKNKFGSVKRQLQYVF